MSGLNALRKGLDDTRSSLFYNLFQLYNNLCDWWPLIEWAYLFENVASAPIDDIKAISAALGVRPFYTCASAICHIRRPRLYWCSFGLEPSWAEQCPYEADRVRVPLQAEPGPTTRWLTRGCTWDEDEGRARLPTAVRAIPRTKPPFLPAGIDSCTSDALKRWEQDKFAMAPYQYKKEHCVRDNRGGLRVPSAAEREVLMGFPPRYTERAVTSSALKRQLKESEVIRKSLLANSFQTEVVGWLLGHLAAGWTYLAQVPSSE